MTLCFRNVYSCWKKTALIALISFCLLSSMSYMITKDVTPWISSDEIENGGFQISLTLKDQQKELVENVKAAKKDTKS